MEQNSAKSPWQGWHKTVCSTAWERSLGWELCSGSNSHQLSHETRDSSTLSQIILRKYIYFCRYRYRKCFCDTVEEKRTMAMPRNHNLEIFGTLQVGGKTPQRSENRGRAGLAKGWGKPREVHQLPSLGNFFNQIWPQIQSNLSLTVPCEELWGLWMENIK